MTSHDLQNTHISYVTQSFKAIALFAKNAIAFSTKFNPRINSDTNAVPSIKDWDSNCGINNDNGVVLKLIKKDTAEIVIMAFTKK